MSKFGIIREFWSFLRVRKKWWLAPIVVFLFTLGLILVLAEEQELPPEAHAGVPVLFKPLGQKALLRAMQSWIG